VEVKLATRSIHCATKMCGEVHVLVQHSCHWYYTGVSDQLQAQGEVHVLVQHSCHWYYTEVSDQLQAQGEVHALVQHSCHWYYTEVNDQLQAQAATGRQIYCVNKMVMCSRLPQVVYMLTALH
jgi:ribosomal protein L31